VSTHIQITVNDCANDIYPEHHVGSSCACSTLDYVNDGGPIQLRSHMLPYNPKNPKFALVIHYMLLVLTDVLQDIPQFLCHIMEWCW
jgi:hypothetical protein